MPKGVTAKGYKMTENRKQILGLLVEEGGTIKSSEGRATSLMHGLLDTGSSMASLNAALKELENIGFVRRQVEGRRTYEIMITNQGKNAIGAVEPAVDPTTNGSQAPEATATQEPEAPASETPASETPASETPTTGPVAESDWDWQERENEVKGSEVPGGIDYDILLGVFLKAALRGMEGTSNSNNGEVAYYKQQIDQKEDRILQLEEEVNKFRAEAAHAIAERDQLQKNFNLVMSRAEGKGTRGSNPIRNLLRPEELGALDALMRQLPTTRGE